MLESAQGQEVSIRMKDFGPLDSILIVQFILFLVLWSMNRDVKSLQTINGIVFVVLFFLNGFLKKKKRRKGNSES